MFTGFTGRKRAAVAAMTGAAVAAASLLAAGCSASVTVGGPSAIPKHTIESKVATTLAQEVPETSRPRWAPSCTARSRRKGLPPPTP